MGEGRGGDENKNGAVRCLQTDSRDWWSVASKEFGPTVRPSPYVRIGMHP